MQRQRLGVAALSMVAAANLFPATGRAAVAPDNQLHIDEILITGSPLARNRFDVVQGTSVLTGGLCLCLSLSLHGRGFLLSHLGFHALQTGLLLNGPITFLQ